MKLLVTGSSGRLGGAVVRELLTCGHEVLCVDVRASEDAALPPTQLVNLLNLDALAPLVMGVDAIFHLGNHPSFGKTGQSVGFANNVCATFNIFQAALTAGVKKIIVASSVQSYGNMSHTGEGLSYVVPRYLPVDEAHPLLATNPYAQSKMIGELQAEALCRRAPGTQVVSLRYTGIWAMDHAPTEADLWRMFQKPPRIAGSLFTYIRLSEAARATRLALDFALPGHHAFNVVAARSVMPWSQALLHDAYGADIPFQRPITPCEPLICWHKAHKHLSFVSDPLQEDFKTAEREHCRCAAS